MTINRTTLLDLPLPVTGTESGTWGDTTNNGLTQYMDIAIAGMSNLTSANFTAGAVTIETTEGTSSATNIVATSAQYAGFRVTSLAQNSTITVGNTGTSPARSYRLINADATYSLTFKATGQTGVTLLPGQSAVVAFNGTDYVIVGMVGAGTATDNAVVRFDGTTGKLVQNSVVTIADSTGDISGVGQLNATTVDATNIEVTNIKAKDGTAAASIADSTGVVTVTAAPVMSALTASQAVFTTAGKALTSNAITGTGNVVMSASPTLTGTVSAAAATLSGNLTLSGGTANGVLYLNGSKVATSGSALTFDGAILGVNGVSVGRGAGAVSTNTAVGASALATNTTGANNTAVGYLAANKNTTGRYSVAMGQEALYNNTTADYNVAIGLAAAYLNTTGAYNVGIGGYALYANTTASNNTAVGYQAGYSNQTSGGGVFIGYRAGYSSVGISTTINYNTAIGYQAGYALTSGYGNALIGNSAGNAITTGYKNSILGTYSGNQGGLDIRTLSNRIVLSDGDGNPRWYIDNVGAAGYGPTTGGAVTQATSRTTGVTLNTPTGAITLVSAAGTTTWQTFTVTNSSVAATDTLIVNQKSGTDLYEIHVTAVAAGSFNISFKTTGGTTTEQPVFNYALIKGQTS